jgi:hypothetical protein
MGLLTEEQQMEMALAHGKLFSAVCDECGRCVPTGTMYVILKYEKIHRIDWQLRPYIWNRRVPKKIRCLDCNKAYLPEPDKKKIVIGGKGRKKLSEDEVKSVNKIVRRTAIRLLKKSEKPIENVDFKTRLFTRVRKKDPKIKKGMMNATLRVLRKVKVVSYKKKHWALVEK